MGNDWLSLTPLFFLSVCDNLREQKMLRSKAGWGCLPGKQNDDVTLKNKSMLRSLWNDDYRTCSRQTDLACVLSLLVSAVWSWATQLLCQSSVSSSFKWVYKFLLYWIVVTTNDSLMLYNIDKHGCFINAQFPSGSWISLFVSNFYNKPWCLSPKSWVCSCYLLECWDPLCFSYLPCGDPQPCLALIGCLTSSDLSTPMPSPPFPSVHRAGN